MPKTEVYFFQHGDGTPPVRLWLRELRRTDPRAHAKCTARIARLAEAGHELRRPEADYLRDGIRELRVRRGHVNYRVLYFFHGANTAILVHALQKEGALDDSDIERASRRKAAFESDPQQHVHED